MTQVHRTLDPDGVPAAGGGYIHTAVVPAGTELLFVAGRVPEDLDGSVPVGFAEQARLAWRGVTSSGASRLSGSRSTIS